MARELGQEDPVPFGLALDILTYVEEIEKQCKVVRRGLLDLTVAMARHDATSATSFRSHAKTPPLYPPAATHAVAMPPQALLCCDVAIDEP